MGLHPNKTSREEIAVIAIIFSIIFAIGAATGWAARVVTTRDKVLVSISEHHFAWADWYQEQLNQIVKEETKEKSSNKTVKQKTKEK
jgi:uncharacterized membrane protein